jgi:hypothetical protein
MSIFGKHQICDCKQLSYELLLYRAGADLAFALSKTLSISGFSVLENHVNDFSVNFESVCEQINTKLHKESTSINHDVYQLLMLKVLFQQHAELWQIIVKITMSNKKKLLVPFCSVGIVHALFHSMFF